VEIAPPQGQNEVHRIVVAPPYALLVQIASVFEIGKDSADRPLCQR
jgi:hypothetical protein